jgi:hypothetical protein
MVNYIHIKKGNDTMNKTNKIYIWNDIHIDDIRRIYGDDIADFAAEEGEFQEARVIGLQRDETINFNPFDNSFNIQYELARHVGDARFGSECKHERTSNGKCLNCQRKVM